MKLYEHYSSSTVVPLRRKVVSDMKVPRDQQPTKLPCLLFMLYRCTININTASTSTQRPPHILPSLPPTLLRRHALAALPPTPRISNVQSITRERAPGELVFHQTYANENVPTFCLQVSAFLKVSVCTSAQGSSSSHAKKAGCVRCRTEDHDDLTT